jgi:hypothetical protein
MKKIFFLFLILPILTLAQEIKWGGYTKYQGTTLEIIQNQKNFFTLRNKKVFIFNSIHISKFEGFNQVYSERIHKKIGGRTATVIGFEILNNQPIIILSNQFQNKKIIYIQKLNDKGLPAGPAIEIMQYDMPKSWFSKGSVSYSISQNKHYLLIDYHIEADKKNNKKVGYIILNSDLKKINQGTLEFVEKEDCLYSYEIDLLNDGKLFLLKKITQASEGVIFKTYNQITDLELLQVKGDTLNPIKINPQKNKFVDIHMNSNDQQLSIVGLYTRDESTYKIDGSYYFNYDHLNSRMINEGVTTFNTEFITQNWSERAKKRALEREAKGKESPALYDYYIKNVIPLKDSSLLFIMEQYYVNTITYTDPKTGYVTTKYIYHYNDLIVGKVSPDDKIEWMQLIPKSQVTENDGGYYSSYASYTTDNKLTIYFNDGASLYDKAGNYKEKADFVLFSKLRRVLAVVELDLASGNYTRKNSNLVTKRSEIAIPSLFSNNASAKTFILLLRKGYKENFGVLNY